MVKQSMLLTGATGMVGSRIAPLLSDTYQLLTPSHQELDVISVVSVNTYVEHYHPKFIIHAAAFTDGTAAEKDRGNKQGSAWKINVEGTRNIYEAAQSVGAFVVYISTGSVFAGSLQSPGPFSEDASISSEENLSWYGVTKAVGESYIKEGSIVRISHPIGGSSGKKDYLEQLWERYKHTSLYPLFTDQPFPLTYIPDLVEGVKMIIDQRLNGIFHIISRNETTPFDLMNYVVTSRHLDSSMIRPIHFAEFIQDQKLPLRYSQYSNLQAKNTYQRLQIPWRSWREIVDLCLLQ